jgi:hypothetical protein
MYKHIKLEQMVVCRQRGFICDRQSMGTACIFKNVGGLSIKTEATES